MKFLIAGYGSIGRRHFRNLLALGEHDIVLYRTGRGTLPDEELQGYPVEVDLRAALSHHPDAVIVANPTALHMDVAIPAAEAGCHLLLEKPISHSLEHTSALRAALAQGGSRVLVAFQYRFHPCLVNASKLIADGAIGRTLYARAHYGDYLPNWHPWEDYRKSYSSRGDLGGGVVLTLCHPLDYVRWLLGEVNSVWAFTGKLSDLQIEVEDTAEINLCFENGALGSIHLDYYQQPSVHSLDIIGTEGSLAWNQGTNDLSLFRARTGIWEIFPAPAAFERNDMFLAEMRHFVQLVNGRTTSLCSLEDGERALKLALAVHQSALEQRRIVVTSQPQDVQCE